MGRLAFWWFFILFLCVLVWSLSVSAQKTIATSSAAEKNFFVAKPSSSNSSDPSVDTLFDSLTAVQHFSEVSISPDAKQVAWVQAARDKNNVLGEETAIYIAETVSSGVAPRRLSAADDGKDYSEGDIAWSPDGKQLAFL